MAKQLLKNRGFEYGLADYFTQGKVSEYGDVAKSGLKSVLLLSSPTSAAEISQVVLSVRPGAAVRFSFFARRFTGEEATSVSGVWAAVNFLSLSGTIVPPSIIISVRGSDLGREIWYCYEEYGEVPPGVAGAQVLIRLAPPESGTSGILIDDLALVSDLVVPTDNAPAVPAPSP